MSARMWSNLQRPKIKKAAAPKTEYRARVLNADDIEKMSSDELRFHEIHNRQALDAALKSKAARLPQQREDARVTGSTSGASREAGERKGWNATKVLSYADIQSMTADESLWQSRFNPSWKAAFDEESRRQQSKKHLVTTKTKLQWEGHATPEEDEAARIAGDTFAKKFPQFERSLPNAQAMARYMQENDLPGTELSSYITAFRALSEKGELTPAKTESADEFLKNHPELLPKAVPPLIASQQAKVKATEEHFAKTQAASARAGSTTVVDYEDDHTGYPAAPTKYSFRKLVDSLSADEYQRRMNEDPQFAAAIGR